MIDQKIVFENKELIHVYILSYWQVECSDPYLLNNMIYCRSKFEEKKSQNNYTHFYRFCQK